MDISGFKFNFIPSLELVILFGCTTPSFNKVLSTNSFPIQIQIPINVFFYNTFAPGIIREREESGEGFR